MTQLNWYVVYTKPRCELKVSSLLARKNIRNYCPLHLVCNQLLDSKKPLFEPLFGSLVFVYIQESEIPAVLHTPHIISFLYWLNKPGIVKEDEINSIINLTQKYRHLSTEKYLFARDNNESLKPESIIRADGNDDQSVRLALPSLGYYVIANL